MTDQKEIIIIPPNSKHDKHVSVEKNGSMLLLIPIGALQESMPIKVACNQYEVA